MFAKSDIQPLINDGVTKEDLATSIFQAVVPDLIDFMLYCSYNQIYKAEPIVSIGDQTGEGWFLTGEMVELIHSGVPNIVCTQPFGCLPDHVVGKGISRFQYRGD